MIIDRLEFADRYVALNPKFGAAFRFLRQLDAEALEEGRLEIDGEELFAIVERGEGRGPETARLEHHRRYIDIQFVVDGEETLGWSPLNACRHPDGPFDSQRDVGFYTDRPVTFTKVPAGCFAILLPEDGHAPLAGDGPVLKVVVKVAQDLAHLLEDLRAELAASSHLDAGHDARLQQSIAEVEAALAGEQEQDAGFAGRLREIAQELEVSHPRLTHSVGRVADALAQIGI
jgi:YhcH/YjgK/YiaL family protein